MRKCALVLLPGKMALDLSIAGFNALALKACGRAVSVVQQRGDCAVLIPRELFAGHEGGSGRGHTFALLLGTDACVLGLLQ